MLSQLRELYFGELVRLFVHFFTVELLLGSRYRWRSSGCMILRWGIGLFEDVDRMWWQAGVHGWQRLACFDNIFESAIWHRNIILGVIVEQLQLLLVPRSFLHPQIVRHRRPPVHNRRQRPLPWSLEIILNATYLALTWVDISGFVILLVNVELLKLEGAISRLVTVCPSVNSLSAHYI